jgi:hypothetical protein
VGHLVQAHPVLGYGKTLSTAKAAIRHLLEEHACTDIRIEWESRA